jgi:hypothetical protein
MPKAFVRKRSNGLILKVHYVDEGAAHEINVSLISFYGRG